MGVHWGGFNVKGKPPAGPRRRGRHILQGSKLNRMAIKNIKFKKGREGKIKENE